jgi:uncharacterized iron-regulated protein
MKLIYSIVLILIVSSINLIAQDNPSYQIFNKKGKSTNYGKMIKAMTDADIILYGEQHNDAVNHWLQLQVTKSLAAKYPIVLGAEMFEADDQVLMDEYLNDVITESHFTVEGKMWKNYKTDYKPLLDFAKTNDLHFVATNIPRRYASLVNKKGLSGLDDLADEAKAWIAPLPIEVDLTLPGYKWMIDTMGQHATGDPVNIARSQASKDATMAHFILKNMQAGKKFIHYHGSFHSNNYEGIYRYLLKGNSRLKIVTIANVNQVSLDEIGADNLGKADFTVVTPKDGAKSY